jgi:hypothetical protein
MPREKTGFSYLPILRTTSGSWFCEAVLIAVEWTAATILCWAARVGGLARTECG